MELYRISLMKAKENKCNICVSCLWLKFDFIRIYVQDLLNYE